jgi:2,3-bisphosphoglycerate-independent phosphoglycerate mutase
VKKYVIFVGDGMADYPIDRLGGKTPLEFARTPNMDFIARQGRGGTAVMVPRRFTPSSDVATLSLLGYDPNKYYSGRGPLEAASMGVELEKGDIAFRCNLVTVVDDTLVDYSAGHISSKESAALIKFIDEKLGRDGIEFYSGVSYRHLMVIRRSKDSVALSVVECIPPHDILDQSIKKNLPRGEGSSLLRHLMKESRHLLDSHEINSVRCNLGENPGNMIWLWGQGYTPSIVSFEERFGVSCAAISEVDVVRGIARCAHMKVIDVAGTTGYFDTNYKGIAEAALRALGEKDLVFVHIQAPDEAGHIGDVKAKVRAIEDFDREIVGPILRKLRSFSEYRALVLPDHLTTLASKTHTRDAVPFAFCGSDIASDAMDSFNEPSALKGSLHLKRGWKLMEEFLGK